MNRLSKIFQPIARIPKDAVVKNQDITSRSQKLMQDLGLIRAAGNGTFHILPMCQRSVDKCSRMVDWFMQQTGAQKMTMPLLTPAELWKKSGRFNQTTSTELLTTRDRHEKVQILGPTHEEAITSLLATYAPLSYRQFPLRLYQIGYKFRDELKPRFGLMRAKEFLMKDCYTFDTDRLQAEQTYATIRSTYASLFAALRVPFVEVQADTGDIGGSLSHEFHFAAEVGEDVLITCTECTYSSNVEICGDSLVKCPVCHKNALGRSAGIEVAHSFLLEHRYTKPLGATYLHSNGKPAPLVMGCFGIGITRLIAASVECLSLEHEIRWPMVIAPFSVCIIPPKEGSKEEVSVKQFTNIIYDRLNGVHVLNDDVIVDDRTNLTIGKRLMEAKRFGYPIIIVVGPKAAAEDVRFEMHQTLNNEYAELSLEKVVTETIQLVESSWYRNVGHLPMNKKAADAN